MVFLFFCESVPLFPPGNRSEFIMGIGLGKRGKGNNEKSVRDKSMRVRMSVHRNGGTIV